MKHMFIFILLFVALPVIAQQDETIDYYGGEMYQVLFNGDTPITRPAGQVQLLSYNKFYKSYTVLFKTQDTTDGINKTIFSYLSENVENGKTIIYYIESSSKDVYFASPDTLERERNILFIRKEPIEGVIYGIAIKNVTK